jgi:hypothetical protein
MVRMQPTELRWAGLVVRSESDFPHEWPFILWVIRNRVEAKGYPNSIFGVVTAARQFSHFNQFQGRIDNDETFSEALGTYAGDSEGWSDNDFIEACHCARGVFSAPRWSAPFSHRVFNFWSPRSMVPTGSDPSWASSYRLVLVSGVDPDRFKFGETA